MRLYTGTTNREYVTAAQKRQNDEVYLSFDSGCLFFGIQDFCGLACVFFVQILVCGNVFNMIGGYMDFFLIHVSRFDRLLCG